MYGSLRAMVQAFVLVVVVLVATVTARPDSAGIVPLVNGFAYGGIPYGSVTGQVAEYYRQQNAGGGLGNSVYDDLVKYGNNIIYK